MEFRDRKPSGDGRAGPRSFLAFPARRGPSRVSGPQRIVMPTSPRLAALSGAAGIVLFDVAWFWAPAAPFLSDRGIASWYAANGNGAWLAAGVLTMLAAPFFLVFAGAVRDRLV